MLTERHLIVFDFDNTIIEENSDLHICKLAPEGKLPKHIKDLYSAEGWNHFMQEIFDYLHGYGTHEVDYRRVLRECTLVAGLADLIAFLVDTKRFDIAIISDANSVFIDVILQRFSLTDSFDTVYTNPAHFDSSGSLRLQPYHEQRWCSLSTVNLCKGDILERHVSKKLEAGVKYRSISYVGDGSNDLCPSLRLDDEGHCFARSGTNLATQAVAAKQRYKGERPKTNAWTEKVEDAIMQAKVHIWTNGLDIIETIKTKILV